MPHRQIAIDFEFPRDEQLAEEQSLVSRVRALGEDLFREFSRNGQAIIMSTTSMRLQTALAHTFLQSPYGKRFAFYQQTAGAPQACGYRAYL